MSTYINKKWSVEELRKRLENLKKITPSLVVDFQIAMAKTLTLDERDALYIAYYALKKKYSKINYSKFGGLKRVGYEPIAYEPIVSEIDRLMKSIEYFTVTDAASLHSSSSNENDYRWEATNSATNSVHRFWY